MGFATRLQRAMLIELKLLGIIVCMKRRKDERKGQCWARKWASQALRVGCKVLSGTIAMKVGIWKTPTLLTHSQAPG
jgi:hypothetical protein